MTGQDGHKRAVILVADVAGYSRLVGVDEAGTLALLRAAEHDIVRPAIHAGRGRVVKTTGDGVIAEFPNADSAVRAAIVMQSGVLGTNAGREPSRRIDYRIGINAGEIVVRDGDVFGDVVNVAARLEQIAVVGGVCVSDAVRKALTGVVKVSWTDGGHRELRNIGRPLKVWHWVSPHAPPAAAQGQLFGRWRPTIAVLPFDNLSGDPGQEYFADGLTEDLITALTHWRVFPVVARNSTFTFKGRAVSIPLAARELGANYVVEGSVRKAGNRIRVTGQLIDAATGHHIWAERYDRDVTDIFEVQDDLTHRIATVIAPEVSRAELRRTAQKRPSDLDAWDHVIRGDAALALTTTTGFAEARDHYERAIKIDPEYSDAFSGLASSHYRPVQMAIANNSAAALEKAVELARRAVELDPASARAHFALSTAYILQNDHDLALAEARIAVDLNPNDPEMLHALGNKSDLAGDQEGIPRMELAQQLNPRDPRIAVQKSFLARAYVITGDFSAAVSKANEAIASKPDYGPAHFIKAIALAHADRVAEAAEALRLAEAANPGILAERRDWRPYTDPERNRHLADGLRKAMLNVKSA